MSRGNIILTASLLALLGAAVWVMIVGWQSAAGVEMSSGAIASMILGVAFSLVIGCGLMFLVFYSSRRGYDEPGRLIRKDDE